MLAQKQLANESLRSDLNALQSKFDSLTIAKTDVDARLEHAVQETTTIRNQLSTAPPSDPLYLQGEIIRLSKALESKTKDFDYLAARYQEASAAASESAAEVLALKGEVEKLKRQLEVDVKQISWEGERKVLIARVEELEGRCKLLEERGKRMQNRDDS